MDDKMFALWEENRRKGQRKFVLSYGFTATLLALLLLIVVKIFLYISTSMVITIILALGLIGILFGYLVWQRYEKLYLRRLEDEKEGQ